MKIYITLVAMVFATQVAAHTGHLAGLAGHDHWVGAAAIGAAIAVGVWAAWKGKKPESAADEDEAGEEEPQEA